ncbi:CTQ-dependent lysine 6-oxidase LodA [Sorangium sp. So ce1078]|uniref:CTQ-dependent lysine 6-oxidase LodA n=1 Tax=Sorangium sp. So ce1078 TaxID=3133329 RepID=UPI003F6121F4
MIKKTYQIHPRVGVARVGNSPKEFYLGPETTGGLPIECDRWGNAVTGDGEVRHVKRYKDAAGAIKRQAARFKIYEHDGSGTAREVSLRGDIVSVQWTVHIANKKSVWYNFSELQGDLMFGPENSYKNQHVPLRNATPEYTTDAQRQKLITDPGPRAVCRPRERVAFSRYNIPADYKHGQFPPTGLSPMNIDSLGEIMMDDDGRLIVLGAFGNNGGPPGTSITSFAGAEGFYDDIADGYVLATITHKDGTTEDLEPAYVLIGSPKYAPELVNIITLEDTIYDVAVRYQGFDPRLYTGAPATAASAAAYDPLAGYNPDYRPNYRRDIEPIITRPQGYRWVAQVPTMMEFAFPRFDTTDASEKTRAARMRYFSYFRVPVTAENYRYINEIEKGPNQLLADDGVPLMPLQSGDNSVTNKMIYKFLTLTPTQYFFLSQWAKGIFDTGEPAPDDHGGVTALDRQVLSNCVGGPFSPGIETTWVVRNPALYASPFQFKVAHWEKSNGALERYYAANGLSPSRDAQEGGGLEPGDLTKQMAIPWQADFFDCTVQTPNISNPQVNQSPADDGIQIPPTFYVYWWPPQAPMQVVAGSVDPGMQVLDGYVSNQPAWQSSSNGVYSVMNNYSIVAAGQTVAYHRGVNTFDQMLVSWQDLGFIVNQGTSEYPNFVEMERNTSFLAQGVATGEK